jgi:hypothetical protein
MKAWLFAGAAILVAASALAPTARAVGPRASSENNWQGIRDAPDATAPVQSAPHYVWHEGYDHGGNWHGHWVFVR